MRKNFWIAFSLLPIMASVSIHALDRDQKQGWSDGLQKWRTDRATALTAPDGWLTVVALDWLKHGENTIGTAADDGVRLVPAGGSAAGNAHLAIIDVERDSLQLKAPRGGFPAELQVDDHPAQAQAIVVDSPHPTRFTVGSLTLFVIHRGDKYALRVKDSQSPARLGFHGLNWYAPNPQYRIEAQWAPYAQPKEVQVLDVVGIVTKGLVPGVARFRIDGRELTLEPVVESLNAKSLMFVLRDATSGKTTYPASRFLYTSLPTDGLEKPGTIVLDFNRLVNPPCAFTEYATCPLPLESNRLKVALEVGEKKYRR